MYQEQNLFLDFHNILNFLQDLLEQKVDLNLNHLNLDEALLTCLNKSVLPIISFKDLKPN